MTGMNKIRKAVKKANKRIITAAKIRKGEHHLRGGKNYLKEKAFAERFLKDEKPVKVKKMKNKVAYRVDPRTVVMIDKDATPEYKEALKAKYAVERHADDVMQGFKRIV